MAQSHRGLPPPAAMALPSASSSSSIGPIPPHLWQNSEETVRSLLQIKTEEQRYATEQERTKQEELRFRTRETELRTRETELTMLREALQGGVPGHVVAMIFASSNRISDSISIQDYSATEYQQQSRAPPPPAPALRREPRLIGPAVHNSAPVPPQSMPPPVVGPTWDAHQPGYSSYAARGSTNRSSQSGPSGQSGQPQPPPPLKARRIGQHYLGSIQMRFKARNPAKCQAQHRSSIRLQCRIQLPSLHQGLRRRWSQDPHLFTSIIGNLQALKLGANPQGSEQAHRQGSSDLLSLITHRHPTCLVRRSQVRPSGEK